MPGVERAASIAARAEEVLARNPKLAAVACGALATLAMPPVFAWPVLFIAFVGG